MLGYLLCYGQWLLCFVFFFVSVVKDGALIFSFVPIQVLFHQLLVLFVMIWEPFIGTQGKKLPSVTDQKTKSKDTPSLWKPARCLLVVLLRLEYWKEELLLFVIPCHSVFFVSGSMIKCKRPCAIFIHVIKWFGWIYFFCWWATQDVYFVSTSTLGTKRVFFVSHSYVRENIVSPLISNRRLKWCSASTPFFCFPFFLRVSS